MTIESTLTTLLNTLFTGEAVYPDEAPAKPPAMYCVYQQVGGQALGFVDPTKPSKKNARIQVAVWGADREEVNAKMRAIEDLITTTASLQAEAIGALTAAKDPDTKRLGARQDFSMWFND